VLHWSRFSGFILVSAANVSNVLAIYAVIIQLLLGHCWSLLGC